jgi:hypothetical protein
MKSSNYMHADYVGRQGTARMKLSIVWRVKDLSIPNASSSFLLLCLIDGINRQFLAFLVLILDPSPQIGWQFLHFVV